MNPSEFSEVKPRTKKGRFAISGHRKRTNALREALSKRLGSEANGEDVDVDITEGNSDYTAVDHDYTDLCREISVESCCIVSENDSIERSSWRGGRRVVQLGVLADALKGCQLCSQPLQLINCVGEKKYGLSSLLQIKCHYEGCGLVNDIPTGSRHKTDLGCKLAWRLAWNANSNVAAGMINVGLGETQINSLLAVLNIPTITPGSLKNREREISNQLIQMAEDSCKKQLEEETVLTDNDISVGSDGA